MRLPLLRRMLNVAALGTGVALAALTASPAHAGVEVGATAGLHVFSINNELGVPDTVKATSLRNSALFGLRLGFMFNDMIGVEAEAGIIPSEDRNLVYDVFTGTVRGHVIAQFRAANPANKLVPFVVLGGGATKVLSSDREDRIDLDTDAALYVGVGAKYRVENGWGLRADGRLLLPPSSKNESAALDGEILLSVYKEFGRKEAPKGEEPPPPVEEDKDPDKDGILGDADGCPTDAEDADGFQDEDGCPDGDNDGDGIADASDQCPSDPEDADGFKDEDGCPDPDNDGDGIADATDQCPAEPEDADGFEDENGCPDPDNDGDGVLDAADTCPDKLETKNGYQDTDGCPDEIPAPLAKFTGVIKGINFKTGSADIVKTSFKILDKAVKVMQDYPDIKLEVQGHTDDVGDDAANLELSQKRAESVKAYFEGKGIAADRVTAKGYGETAPSAPIDGLKGGKLKAAQAKNRRVEFKLLSDLQQ
ncbi:MAG: OmpA family protein [Myxococcales bacterium]|nr:OmpA family protein [Myxococcales bacterium]